MKGREFVYKFNPLISKNEYILTCECGAKTTAPTKGLGSHFPPEMIAKVFTNKGWEVGRKDGEDKCPSCLAKRPQPATIAVPKQEEVPVTVTKPKSPVEVTAAKAASVIPPAQIIAPLDSKAIDRENRRKIWAKLNEVYQGDLGYKEGWSDARVSIELAVSRKLVAEIRAENFGDIGTNPELQRLADEIEKVRKEVNPLFVAAEAAWMRAKAEMEACHQEFQKVAAQKLVLDTLQSRAASIRGAL